MAGLPPGRRKTGTFVQRSRFAGRGGNSSQRLPSKAFDQRIGLKTRGRNLLDEAFFLEGGGKKTGRRVQCQAGENDPKVTPCPPASGKDGTFRITTNRPLNDGGGLWADGVRKVLVP